MIMLTVGERKYKTSYSMCENTLYFENYLGLVGRRKCCAWIDRRL